MCYIKEVMLQKKRGAKTEKARNQSPRAEDQTRVDNARGELIVVDSADSLSAYQAGGVPGLVARLGAKARNRYATFFTDNIRNSNTREAYARACYQFFAWCELHGLLAETIESYHVSAYIEVLSTEKSTPTVKQHLAAIRMLYDWLVIGQIIPSNPAHAVRGPKHVVTQGLTPILDKDDMKALLAAIDTDTVVGLRDRAIIGVMTATFARVQATLGMNVDDYFPEGKGWSIRLYEKNSKVVTMPVQHTLEKWLDAYIEAVGGAEVFPFETSRSGKLTKKQPLFLSARGRSQTLTGRRMTRQDAWKMIKRRAKAAGINTAIRNHSFRGTGITDFLTNGGQLPEAQRMAGHADPRTTKLYDRRNQQITRGEVERITILG
jgi:site-specific recombinase XerD